MEGLRWLRWLERGLLALVLLLIVVLCATDRGQSMKRVQGEWVRWAVFYRR